MEQKLSGTFHKSVQHYCEHKIRACARHCARYK